MIHLVTYATHSHSDFQLQLSQQAVSYGIVSQFNYTDKWMKRQLVYTKYKRIFDTPRGAGYWAWKPLILLSTFAALQPDDIMLYLDSSTFLTADPKPIIHEHTPEVLTAVQTCFPGRQYTKRDCFIAMDCDSEEYWDTGQVWAGVIAVRVCEAAKKLLTMWQDWCLNYHVISDEPSVEPNFPDFVDHRHDQSILSNLVVKYKLPTFNTQLFMDR